MQGLIVLLALILILLGAAKHFPDFGPGFILLALAVFVAVLILALRQARSNLRAK
jgi:hypothetical protein